MTRALTGLCVVVLAGPVAPPAVPGPPSDAELEARYQDAVIALQESHPEVALGLFEWVLASVPPTHVLRPLATYGAARAAAASSAPGHACGGEARVREYLALPDGEASKRERLLRALPELESRCAAQKPPPVATASAPAPAPVVAPPSVATETLDARLGGPVVEPAERDDPLRLTGWVSVAAGAALTAAGGYFWYAATQAQDEAAAATTIQGHQDRVDAMETAGGLALGLTLAGGLGLVGGSGLLLYTGAK